MGSVSKSELGHGKQGWSGIWGDLGSNRYHTSYSYDQNGNITLLNREGNAVNMDALTYNYTSGTNKLSWIDDSRSSGAATVDIDDQSSGNYGYDASGQLIKDTQEGIANGAIVWSVYGKVKEVTETSTNRLKYYHNESLLGMFSGRIICIM